MAPASAASNCDDCDDVCGVTDADADAVEFERCRCASRGDSGLRRGTATAMHAVQAGVLWRVCGGGAEEVEASGASVMTEGDLTVLGWMA